MQYNAFLKLVAENRWTLADLRCEVRPSEELLEVMGQVGLDRYEEFVTRFEEDGQTEEEYERVFGCRP